MKGFKRPKMVVLPETALVRPETAIVPPDKETVVRKAPGKKAGAAKKQAPARKRVKHR